MYSSAELQLIYKFANAPVNGFPYPHCFIEDVFPDDFYAELQSNLPDPAAMISLEQTGRVTKGAYKERFVMDMSGKQVETLPEEKRDFWHDFREWLLSGRFRGLALSKFQTFVEARFKGMSGIEFSDEMVLVEDITKYALGPHTDSPKKVITMLFYFPKDLSQVHMGTSIYVPKDPNFRCPGGPHHGFDGFMRLCTMPFKPNSLFIFVKTDNSFHGVEPVRDPDTKRWLLQYDIYRKKPETQPLQTQQAMAQPGSVKFSF